MDVYEEIQYELWCERQAAKCSTLTPFEIAGVFGEEALEIIPRLNRIIKRRLFPLREKLADLHEEAREKRIDKLSLQFCLEIALMFSGQQENISALNRNNAILKFARQRKSATESPSPNPVNQDTIALAKLKPILQMYSFEKLRHTGGKYMAVCPFHGDRGPSFFIYNNNTYHCFGCQANGSAVDFYMKLYNVDFFNAVKALAGV